MHIIFVFENFTLGGVERVSEQLIIGLKKLYQCKISIICERNQGELTNRFAKIAPIFILRNRNNFTHFKKISNSLSPDLVVFTKGGLSKYSIMLSNHIKTVAIQHVPINLPEKSKMKNLLRKSGAKLLYSRVDHIVCVSDGILTNLVQLKVIKSEKASRIYNPVLDNKIKEMANCNVEYQDYFVSVGRLHYQKGYDLLISAIFKVKETLDSIKVVIIGDGPERSSLEELIREKNLERNIIIHGPSKNPYKYIANSNGILLSSRWEGLPTVLVEAAYLDRPIIAFDCRYGPKELTENGKSGYLVNFLDTNSLAERIVFLYNSKTSMKSPNVESFSLSAATTYYYSLFKSLL